MERREDGYCPHRARNERAWLTSGASCCCLLRRSNHRPASLTTAQVRHPSLPHPPVPHGLPGHAAARRGRRRQRVLTMRWPAPSRGLKGGGITADRHLHAPVLGRGPAGQRPDGRASPSVRRSSRRATAAVQPRRHKPGCLPLGPAARTSRKLRHLTLRARPQGEVIARTLGLRQARDFAGHSILFRHDQAHPRADPSPEPEDMALRPKHLRRPRTAQIFGV